MLTTLSNFDPIAFLEIDPAPYSPQELQDMRNELNNNIGEYVLLKCSESLTEEQLNQANAVNGEQSLALLRSWVPNFDTKMLAEIENFKNEYQTVLGGQNA